MPPINGRIRERFVNAVEKLLEKTFVYRLWQAPFAEAKLAPVLANNDVTTARRVLDVGCGPGTNTRHFLSGDYLGIDLNEKYISYARRRYGRSFMVADVTALNFPNHQRFDFVLINSLLHHLDDGETRRLLRSTASLLSSEGHVHILELVLPADASVARLLARLDRGHHARPLEKWDALLGEVYEPVLFQTYALSALGVPLWNMVYFKGRPKE